MESFYNVMLCESDNKLRITDCYFPFAHFSAGLATMNRMVESYKNKVSLFRFVV